MNDYGNDQGDSVSVCWTSTSDQQTLGLLHRTHVDVLAADDLSDVFESLIESQLHVHTASKDMHDMASHATTWHRICC